MDRFNFELHVYILASSAVSPAQLMEDARASCYIKAEQKLCSVPCDPNISNNYQN